MKIIKITTENEITTLEFPEGDITSVNKRLYEMIVLHGAEMRDLHQH